jgi:Cu-processing system permease protein
MTRHARTIARLELVTAVRTRWVQTFTCAFASICIAVAWSAGAMRDIGAAEGFARTTVALVPIVLILVPLAALLLGVAGHAGEPGSEAFLYAQPVSRFTVTLGKAAGQAAALGSSILLGLTAGALLIVANAGTEGVLSYAWFVLASIVLAAVFLSIAALVATVTPRRTAALGLAAFVWFFFVLLYDGIALAAAAWLTGRTGGYVLFGSVFGNPTGLVRVLALSISGTPYVLGAAGEGWHRFLGGPASATAWAGAALLVWIALPLAAARQLGLRRDL